MSTSTTKKLLRRIQDKNYGIEFSSPDIAVTGFGDGAVGNGEGGRLFSSLFDDDYDRPINAFVDIERSAETRVIIEVVRYGFAP